jgi:hypothetical protein
MLIDFTFKNELIKKYFEGDDSYVPTSELIYLHEHPLIKQSFLTEIEKKINETSEFMIKRNMQGAVLNKFIDSTIILGTEMSSITQQSAPKILNELRKIYKLCNSLLN